MAETNPTKQSVPEMGKGTPVSALDALPTVRLESRLEVPRWLPIVTSAGALVVAFAIGAVVIRYAGGNPGRVYLFLFRAAFGSAGALSDTLVTATPMILTGLACAVAFRMRLWNIGAEGQFLMGAWGASAVVLALGIPASAPRFVVLLLMALAGLVCGALWALVPGYMKAKLNVNEVLTTLVMNYLALPWILFWVFGAWSDKGFQMSPMFPRTAWLPRLSDLSRQVPSLAGLTVHLGLLLGLVAAFAVWLIVSRSRWGYEIRLIGDNPRAAAYAGVDIVRNTVMIMMLSGGLAGLAGMVEVSGVVHRLQGSISPGYGFAGVTIAWLAKLNPLAIILVAILFGGLIQAGREIQPTGVARMFQGIILFCVIASDVFLRYRVRVVRVREA
jgi:ABC-type uncharacterized transport system permease subunit